MNEQQSLSTAAEPLEHDTHLEHIRITREWAILFSVVFAVVIVVSSVLGALLTAAAPLWLVLPFGSAFVCGLIVAMAVVRSLEYSRYCLQTRFEQWVENQTAGREIAKIQATQNVSVNIKGRQNSVVVGAGQSVESVRLIPLRNSGKLVDGVLQEDLSFFCERVPVIGFSKRTWLGQTLPSGKLVSTFDDYNQLIQPLCKAGVIMDRGERSAGKLTTNDAGAIKTLLGLSDGAEVKEISG